MGHDVKKHFYKKLFYEPFPVESSLLQVLPDRLNAKKVTITISSKQEAMDYLTWTYFFRHFLVNPTYYELESIDTQDMKKFLNFLLQSSLNEIRNAGSIETGNNGELSVTTPVRIASFYYLANKTLKMFRDAILNDNLDIDSLIDRLA
jgi:activating signal cointegrator complex subunit 3